MCDTLVALPSATADGMTLFAKNSDRQRNEAQRVQCVPRSTHEPGASLQCTYITIPQVAQTNAVLLCKPFWIWGAEMGANEHGVAIGNEAVHARTPAPEGAALTGMDLVRLGLERAETASAAVDVLAGLLSVHGQGGNCGHIRPSFYNNSFLIADAREAFVLETVGNDWLAQSVRDLRAISNVYSITGPPDRSSPSLEALLRKFGAPAGSTDYAALIRHPEKQHISQACERAARAGDLLRQGAGNLRVADMQRILRDHGHAGSSAASWSPSAADHYSLCMHAGALDRGGQTTGSMVSELGSSSPIHWVTGTSSPCISIFKPVLLDVALPTHGPAPIDQYDSAAMWWRHELAYRRALAGDFAAFLAAIAAERDEIEADFRARIDAVRSDASPEARRGVVASCWQVAGATEERWRRHLSTVCARPASPFDQGWAEMNQLAGVDLGSAQRTSDAY